MFFFDCQYFRAYAELKVVDGNHKCWETLILFFLLKLVRNILLEQFLLEKNVVRIVSFKVSWIQ